MKLRQDIRYLKGSEDYKHTIQPENANSTQTTFDVTTYVGSGWASCATIRKSTTGCTITVASVAIHHYSRTQTTVALSSVELYGLSSCTTWTMGVLQLLQECYVKTSAYVSMVADSTTGKSIASRLGLSGATKHIQLRFLYVQHLVSSSVVRLRKEPTKDKLADLHTKYLSLGRTRHLKYIIASPRLTVTTCMDYPTTLVIFSGQGVIVRVLQVRLHVYSSVADAMFCNMLKELIEFATHYMQCLVHITAATISHDGARQSVLLSCTTKSGIVRSPTPGLRCGGTTR